MEKSATYNGWSNYQTWNVALWMQNDESLYRLARQYKLTEKPYDEFRDHVAMILKELGNKVETPDGVSYYDEKLNIKELDDCIREM